MEELVFKEKQILDKDEEIEILKADIEGLKTQQRKM